LVFPLVRTAGAPLFTRRGCQDLRGVLWRAAASRGSEGVRSAPLRPPSFARLFEAPPPATSLAAQHHRPPKHPDTNTLPSGHLGLPLCFASTVV